MSALLCKTFVCFVSIFFKKEARYIFFFSFLSLMQQWNVQILGNYMESFYWSIESTIWWRHQVYILVTKASLFRKKGSCLIKWPSEMDYENPQSFFFFHFFFHLGLLNQIISIVILRDSNCLFLSIFLGNFITHEPLISEEWKI